MADQATTLLILGASGDLTSRLLLPGLGTLLAVEPERRIRVVGADRAEMSTKEWHDTIRTALEGAEVPEDRVEELLTSADYVQ
ncbi:MAG: glucose-6-phosphate dehydrogenase, partial [Ornithinimicrobium sp.]